MTSLNQAVRDRIRSELDARAISERALARRMEVPRMYLRRRLLGEVEFRPSDLERAAAALGVPVTRLLVGQPVVTP